MKILYYHLSEVKWLLRNQLYFFVFIKIIKSLFYFFPRKIRAIFFSKTFGKAKTIAKSDDIKIILRFNDIRNLKEVFEWEVYKKLKILPQDILLDLGSHIGLYVLKVGKKCRRVIGIEPHPENFKLFSQNVKINKLKNVKIMNVAVSGKNGYVYLFGEGGGATIINRKNNSNFIKVKTMSIKEILRKEKVTVIKCDIEGGEEKVFCTLSKNDLKLIREIILEVHPWMINERKLIKRLKKYFKKLKKYPSNVAGTYILHGVKK